MPIKSVNTGPVVEQVGYCRRMGLRLGLWWRDDDLTKASANLDRLNMLAEKFRAPLLVAVIPALASPSLGRVLGACPLLEPCQHGYAHRNHEGPLSEKDEFGLSRSYAEVKAELALGKARLSAIVGPRLLPVFVSPWSRFHAGFAGALVDCGFRGFSGYGIVDGAGLPAAMKIVNAHVDILSWSTKASLQDPDALMAKLAGVVARLRAKALRDPGSGAVGPIGILSHHRVMDEESWRFIDYLVGFLRDLDGVDWCAPSRAFGL